MFRYRLIVLLVSIFIINIVWVSGQDNQSNALVTIPNTETFTLSSVNTAQTYQIFVALPDNYHEVGENIRYSVVYVLDANYFFGAINDFVRIENLVQELPKMLVVGIGYPQDPLEGRVADMLQNPDKFLSFMSDELVPEIDTRYRTRATTEQRTLMGHSLGGQFVLYTLFKQPELFARYVAASPGSPSWAELSPLEEAFATNRTSLPIRLFMSLSDQEFNEIEPMYVAIQSRNYEGLVSTLVRIENATHGSSAIPALTYCLRFVYE
jgi:predicted alpha/beta superfamily hydrolase